MVAPYFLNIGANSFEILAPAENNAKSICFLEIFFSQSSSTTNFLFLKVIIFPALLFEAKRYKLSIKNFFSSKTFKNVEPTRPVAPTIAKFILFIS